MSNMARRLKRAEERAAARGQVPRAVPTAIELWRHLLVGEVESARKYPRTGELQAHRESLQDSDDVKGASDDVLLEALGLPNVEGWGWLHFMVRELTWFCMLARNWNLPHLRFLDCDFGDTTTAERRAYAARQFCDLMRARAGHDPAALTRRLAEELKEKHEMSDERIVEIIEGASEWMGFVYGYENVPLRPKVLRDGNDAGRVLYEGEFRAQFLAKIRAAQG